MILIVRTTFPRSSVHHAAKAFTLLPRIPATVKRQGPYFHFDEKNNILTTTLYSFGDSHVGNEQRKFVENRLRIFADVPGFSANIEGGLTMEEALAFLKKNV